MDVPGEQKSTRPPKFEKLALRSSESSAAIASVYGSLAREWEQRIYGSRVVSCRAQNHDIMGLEIAQGIV